MAISKTLKRAVAIAQLFAVLSGAVLMPAAASAQTAQPAGQTIITAPAAAIGATADKVPTLVANDQVQQLEAVFQPSESDASLRLLKAILGDWQNGRVHPLLGNAMFTFNSGVLIFAALIFVYTSTTSLAMAAHDGSLVGKGRSSLWLPVRMAIGSALIFPGATGLSLGQHGFLWGVTQGIGLANSVWSTSADGFVANQGNLIALRLAEKQGVRGTMYQILQAETCVEDLKRTHGGDGQTFGLSYSSSGGNGGYLKWGYTGTSIQSGWDSDYCGEIAVAPTSAADRYSLGIASTLGINDNTTVAGVNVGQYKQANIGYVVGTMVDVWKGVKAGNAKIQGAQFEALKAAAESLRPLATEIATLTNSTEETAAVTPLRVANAADAAANIYINAVAKTAQSFAANQNDPLTSAIVKDAKDNGWVTAGVFLYQMARVNSEISEAASWTPKVDNSMPAAIRAAKAEGKVVSNELSPAILDYLDGLIVGAEKIRSDPAQQGALVASIKGGQVDQGYLHGTLNSASNALVGSAAQGAARMVGYDPTNTAHPIIQMKNVGDTIIGSVETAAGIAGASWLVSKIPAAKGVAVAASKAIDASPIGKLMTRITDFMNSPAMSTLFWIGLLLFLGTMAAAITFSYWLPMLPFVIWMGQVLGWVVSVFEMLVAVPVWLAAHLHPEGDGVSGQHAASGYKVVLEILMRPTLLVFGLIGAMLIMTPFMQFFSSTFFNALSTTTSDSLFGIVTFVATIIVYCMMCYMTINMILHAIVQIPNGVMRVIGGMEGTNMRMGGEMSRDVKAAAVTAMNKGVSSGKEGFGYSRKSGSKNDDSKATDDREKSSLPSGANGSPKMDATNTPPPTSGGRR